MSANNLSLSVQYGSLINCLGIQPVFHKNGFIEKSFYGFAYRMSNVNNKAGTMKTMLKYRINEENDIILNNKFHVSQATANIVNVIKNNSFTLKHNGSLDDLMNNKSLLKETIYYYLKRIELYISLGHGNFLITSRKDLYNARLFTASEIYNYTTYLVDEKLLPRNVIIIGHKNSNVYGNPLVISPLIDENHFDSICELNGISLDDYKINGKLRYPMISRYENIFSLYQSYLDNVEVPYWYIETFNNPVKNRQKAYYTTLYFD